MALLEQGNNAPPENCFRLVVLGSAKVGKTALVHRFLFNRFDDTYTPTIEDFHRKVYRIRGVPYRLDILDTSGIHPFPAMRRLSFITGDLFVLVFAIDNQESFQEVLQLREQILASRRQCLRSGVPPSPCHVPMVIAANKADRQAHRVIDPGDVEALLSGGGGGGGQAKYACVETSAKRNTNVDEVFKRLFSLARLPPEMSPSLHRKVNPMYEGRSGGGGSGGQQPTAGRLLNIRRKMSDACGAVDPNVRKPSIHADLLTAQARTSPSSSSSRSHSHSHSQEPGAGRVRGRDTRCMLQ
ncbi:dexamethasone-induced Ras-related protein 1-like [Babylonia areolata]|uniref:dexamethasone-induced Ras-related protein 1-like n=1 Tax=Babylonia areolata TaxID=304850 RepID=UPI003FCFF4EA